MKRTRFNQEEEMEIRIVRNQFDNFQDLKSHMDSFMHLDPGDRPDVYLSKSDEDVSGPPDILLEVYGNEAGKRNFQILQSLLAEDPG